MATVVGPHFLRFLLNRESLPIAVVGVDNYPEKGQTKTSVQDFVAFLRWEGASPQVEQFNDEFFSPREYGIFTGAPADYKTYKFDLYEKVFNGLGTNILNLNDYEDFYMTSSQRKSLGSESKRPLASCNFVVESRATDFGKTFLDHPLFGKILEKIVKIFIYPLHLSSNFSSVQCHSFI